MSALINKIESVEEQRELFLWKFNTVTRPEVNALYVVSNINHFSLEFCFDLCNL